MTMNALNFKNVTSTANAKHLLYLKSTQNL
jgi:hypothetical protein